MLKQTNQSINKEVDRVRSEVWKSSPFASSTTDELSVEKLQERCDRYEKNLATAVEALKDLVSAQEQLWTSINGRGLVDDAIDNAKQALAEIGGEDD
ncbi:hypothetical protein RU85_GL000727 [Lactococcus garvieae]|nr:hypothetical protein RU85_GL000727 [Lactococcus garvieae]